MSTKILTPVKGFTGAVVGVTFADGVGETDNEAAIAYFERHGYTVEHPEPDAPPFPEGELAKSWTVAQLTAWAAAHGLELGEATKKDDILSAIAAATSAGTSANSSTGEAQA